MRMAPNTRHLQACPFVHLLVLLFRSVSSSKTGHKLPVETSYHTLVAYHIVASEDLLCAQCAP
jgi:hypothetical protein